MTHGYVYFVQPFSGGAIKIGYSRSPLARLQSLQSGHPERLDLVAAVPLPQECERVLHEALAEWRLFGEWFEDSPEVCRVIELFVSPGRSTELHRLMAVYEEEGLAA